MESTAAKPGSSDAHDALSALYSELRAVHPERKVDKNSMQRIYDSESVRQRLHWNLPVAEDVSELINVQRGKVLAVRMDLLGEGTGLKQPVVAGLIARSLVRLRDESVLEQKKGFIDGASVSTGLAMGYFDRLLGTQSMLVTSRMTPDDVVANIREKSGNALSISREQSNDPDLESALTRHFIKIVRSREGAPYIPLFHTVHGGEALQPFGNEFAQHMECRPDYVVTTLGAGTTLQGMAIPIKNRSPQGKLVIAEHASCPLVEGSEIDIQTDDISGHDTSWLNNVIPGKKTAIIGPHENTINRFIDPESLRKCAVARYSDEGWRQMAAHCRQQGLSIGPSSAANLYVARGLANKGATVVTFTVEPLREWHMART